MAVLWLLALVVLMVASYYYPYPSGNPPDMVSFLLFWLREALVLVFAVIVLLAIGLAAAVRAIQRSLRSRRAL